VNLVSLSLMLPVMMLDLLPKFLKAVWILCQVSAYLLGAQQALMFRRFAFWISMSTTTLPGFASGWSVSNSRTSPEHCLTSKRVMQSPFHGRLYTLSVGISVIPSAFIRSRKLRLHNSTSPTTGNERRPCRTVPSIPHAYSVFAGVLS
jgi:hypothetical protein